MPRLVYVLPYKPSRLWRFVVRSCLWIAILAAVIYTTQRMHRLIERMPHHGNANQIQRTSPHPRTGHPR